jgi:hypothetical protein
MSASAIDAAEGTGLRPVTTTGHEAVALLAQTFATKVVVGNRWFPFGGVAVGLPQDRRPGKSIIGGTPVAS